MNVWLDVKTDWEITDISFFIFGGKIDYLSSVSESS